MAVINNTAELKEVILQLENKQKEQITALKDQVHTGFRHIKRASLIKNTFMDMVTSPILISTAMDMMTGFRGRSSASYNQKAGTGKMIKEILSILVKFGIARMLMPKRRSSSRSQQA